MSKKNRKTKKEKIKVKHYFNQALASSESAEVTSPLADSVKTKPQIKSLVYLDLRKVISIILVTLIILAVFTFLVYQTNLFESFFSQFGIKY